MTSIMARSIMASEHSARRSYSRASLRWAEIHALARSTAQRRGRTLNPFTSPVRLTTTTSMPVFSRDQAMTGSSTAFAYPPSAQARARSGCLRRASASTSRPAVRSLVPAPVTFRAHRKPGVSAARCRLRPRQCLNLPKLIASPP